MKKLFCLILCCQFALAASAQSKIPNGTISPDFTMTDVNGVNHNLYKYCDSGKYVMVYFFAHWCTACRNLVHTYQSLYRKYGCNKGDLIILGNEADGSGTLKTLKEYDSAVTALWKIKVEFPKGYGKAGTNAANASVYGLSAVPTVVFIGPDRKMINNYIWAFLDSTEIEKNFPKGKVNPKACNTTNLVEIKDKTIDINVSPNPASTSSNLQFTLNESNEVHFLIRDYTGKMQYQSPRRNLPKGESSLTIPLEGLSSGLYWVELCIGKEIHRGIKLQVL